MYVRAKILLSVFCLMNLQAWEKLDSEHHAIVQEAASIVMKEQFEIARKAGVDWVAKWTVLGKNYVELSDAERGVLAKEVRAKVWPEMEKIIGPELMSIIKTNSQKF